MSLAMAAHPPCWADIIWIDVDDGDDDEGVVAGRSLDTERTTTAAAAPAPLSALPSLFGRRKRANNQPIIIPSPSPPSSDSESAEKQLLLRHHNRHLLPGYAPPSHWQNTKKQKKRSFEDEGAEEVEVFLPVLKRQNPHWPATALAMAEKPSSSSSSSSARKTSEWKEVAAPSSFPSHQQQQRPPAPPLWWPLGAGSSLLIEPCMDQEQSIVTYHYSSALEHSSSSSSSRHQRILPPICRPLGSNGSSPFNSAIEKGQPALCKPPEFRHSSPILEHSSSSSSMHGGREGLDSPSTVPPPPSFRWPIGTAPSMPFERAIDQGQLIAWKLSETRHSSPILEQHSSASSSRHGGKEEGLDFSSIPPPLPFELVMADKQSKTCHSSPILDQHSLSSSSKRFRMPNQTAQLMQEELSSVMAVSQVLPPKCSSAYQVVVPLASAGPLTFRPKPKVVRDYPEGVGPNAVLSSNFSCLVSKALTKWNCTDSTDASDRGKVKEVIRKFHSVRKAVQELGLKKRPDLEASIILRKNNRHINTERKVGSVPGIEVGDHFYYRIEMCVVGLHRTPMAGIDSIPGKLRSNGKPLATSIVASGGYEDNEDNGEILKYTGQGGNSVTRRQCGDQNLTTNGNLALWQSHKLGSPVRVIRGYEDKCENKVQPKIYSYDGLYLVTKVSIERGRSGFEVFRFLLRRMPGQPPLGSSVVKLAGRLKRGIPGRNGLIMQDLSRGLERLPICVINEVDDEPAPTGFKYISKMHHPCEPTETLGCDCKNGCGDPEKCLCAKRNGGTIPYNPDGDLMDVRHVLYECGQQCKCLPSCRNRTSQNGLRYPLEVFKTRNRGWGVRSLDIIPIGAFVCEYVGDLLTESEADERVEKDEYLFDIGAHQSSNNAFGDVSDVMEVRASDSLCPTVVDGNFTIDAAKSGNVGRFINHSCSGNLFPLNVMYDHDDLRLSHIMFFAVENIPPLTELSYNYNYKIDQVKDANGMIKRKDCFCGAYNCRGRLY